MTMETVFLENEKISLAAGEQKIEREHLHGLLIAGPIEVREAIEEQTAILHGEQEEWDQSALAKMAHDVNAGQDTTSALAEVVNALVPRMAAFETAARGLVDHQQETAKLVQGLADHQQLIAELIAKIAAKVGD
jgi:hypothetical protein